MAFQPFGYPFDIRSPSPPADVKAAIRSRKKPWFDPKNGARGWVVGPLVCLWFDPTDRLGPMLFGCISQDGQGTRISGRAGSDLNGLAMFTLLMPVLILVLAVGGASTGQLAFFGGLTLLVFWTKHLFRREAEPLVRFLRDAAAASGRPLREEPDLGVSRALTMNVSGEDHEGPVTPGSIHEALLGAGAGDFLILESGPEAYIQTAWRNGGFELEMREGDRLRHFQAVRSGRAAGAKAELSGSIFTFEETLAALMAYASEAPMPRWVAWEAMQLPR